MKIGLLTLRHASTVRSSIVLQAVRLLEEWGADVDVIYPEELCRAVSEVRVEHDLYLLKSETDLALSFAGALHAAGATLLNPYHASSMMTDKLVLMRRLKEAGVPVPASYVAGSPHQLAHLLEIGPLALKPHRGSKGHGVQLIWDPDELDHVADGGLVFAQQYHKPDGRDRKIYCIGGQLFGVMRSWPAHTYEEKLGEAFSVEAALRDIALRAGAAFGVDLFGLDIIISDGQPLVVDMHGFPEFKGVPDAALRLADYVYATAERVLAGSIAASAQKGAA
jgi:ribosomal protein S6--L-glutamate ligase